jgi:aldehyde dehydrogenase (NAD+)
VSADLAGATRDMLIDGAWHRGAGRLGVEDPSTGNIVSDIADGTTGDVDIAVDAARRALEGSWGRMDALSRGRILAEIGRRVLDETEELARIESLDVGKPLSQARNDVIALARYMEFYAGAADKLMGETIPFRPGYTVYTLREPHGVTGHIIPWNYPMQILGRSVGAALATGNACVLKPAEEASLTALAFGRIAMAAGLPAGALNIVPGEGETVGAALAGHPGVDHVSFTGSFHVGGLVQAAAARNAHPVTLELGGKSPQIVFADADLERAMPFLVNAGLQNAGQTCSAASRILVHRSRLGEVTDLMAARYRALTVGSALSDPNVGPLISAKQRGVVQGFAARAEASGRQPVARATLPGGIPAGGHYFAPTLFSDVLPGDELARDEIFGPVQVIIGFDSDEEAIAIANGTGFGLVAGIWTADFGRAMRLSRQVRAGQVFVNDYGAAGGVELPFGGVGKSGHGREKGMEAMYGFTALKTVAAWHGE